MDESTVAPISLMGIPRELRDQIYHHLLSKTYLVDLPPAPYQAPIQDTARASTDTIAPWCSSSPCYEMFMQGDRSQPADQLRLAAKVQPWSSSKSAGGWHWDKELSARRESPHLAVLRVSKTMKEETLPILYRDGTFLFAIDSPLMDTLDLETAKIMNNIEVRLDMLAAYFSSSQYISCEKVLESCKCLLSKFTGATIKRNTCVISIEFVDDSRGLALPSSFFEQMKLLRGFTAVVLRLMPVYRLQSLGPDGDRNETIHFQNINSLKSIRIGMRKSLGPGKTQYDNGEVYCLTFHPQSYLMGSRLPKYDIGGLRYDGDRILDGFIPPAAREYMPRLEPLARLDLGGPFTGTVAFLSSSPTSFQHVAQTAAPAPAQQLQNCENFNEMADTVVTDPILTSRTLRPAKFYPSRESLGTMIEHDHAGSIHCLTSHPPRSTPIYNRKDSLDTTNIKQIAQAGSSNMSTPSASTPARLPSNSPGTTEVENNMCIGRSLMSLPREIRDQIYDHLLCTTYSVDLNFPNGAQEALEVPSVLPPCTFHNSEVSSPVYHSSGKLGQTRFNLLQTSKDVGEEALAMLYERSTFLYLIASPGYDPVQPHFRNRMKNIEIHLSLTSSQTRWGELKMKFGTTVIRSFVGTEIARNTCIIQIRHGYDVTLLLTSFLYALKGLTGFRNVTLKFGQVYRYSVQDGEHGHYDVTVNNRFSMPTYRIICRALRWSLGSGEVYTDGEGYHCLDFHPRDYLTRKAARLEGQTS
ncbi:hypothetical protein MMC28_010115 [Mycoblastus sanguinarius]|nr:hypothetical protein [Mycoblastus sanguinarius]